MPPRQPRTGRTTKQKSFKNAVFLASVTFIVSLLLAGPAQTTMGEVQIAIAVAILAIVIAISVLADILGVAATAAEETPFHAMASDRVPGAKESVMIVRQSAQVNSIFSDVIGDVCGTISGALGAALALDLMAVFPRIPSSVVSVVTLGIVASVTVGAKASTKGFAVRNAKNIVRTAGKLLFVLKRITPKKLLRG